jgi:hypothetical protein
VVCQTNNQADDLCRRLGAAEIFGTVVRFVSGNASKTPPHPAVQVVASARGLPAGPRVVVATSAKWALIEGGVELDAILVDEAWQMTFAMLLPILRMSGQLLLIGDPGQISPVVPSPTERWETSRHPPHLAAPEVLLNRMQCARRQLPATWRLPSDSAGIIAPFYDFAFDCAAQPGERSMRYGSLGAKDEIDCALKSLTTRSITAILLPTPDGGALDVGDREVAQTIAQVAARALKAEAVAESLDAEAQQAQILEPERIGIAATRREMVQAIMDALPRELRSRILVDTAERWQGLQRELMIVAHPLSSVTEPSEFDLETGRLCVVASRHRNGLVVVSRDHVPETLLNVLPRAEQPLGRDDLVGRGLFQHREFWRSLTGAG